MAQFAANEVESSYPYRFQVGFGTDIGGGRENQDEGFIWCHTQSLPPQHQVAVIGILDGHGREVGKTAAMAAKVAILNILDSEHSALLQSPVDFLVRLHISAHDHIKHVFAAEYQKQGYEVKQSEEGYLMKRKTALDAWSCVHGGAACTLIALVGSALYVSNVGDSTALLCTPIPVLSPGVVVYEKDAAYTGDRPGPSSGPPASMLVLTAEHSPESSYEFERLRRFRSREGDPSQPALYVVYDSASHDKSQCAAVFEPSQPVLQPSLRGSYFKNVRKEWASLISTPSTAAFQDALAFTRSLGDLHLHTYGVTHLPEVHRIDLPPLFAAMQARLAERQQSGSEDNVGAEGNILCLVVATDGIWDNWLYEDLARFVTDLGCLRAARASNDGAQRVTTSLMHRNAIYSKRNFGSQADNATGIVMYISQDKDFPM